MAMPYANINPSDEHRRYLHKKAGCYRYIYNSCVANGDVNTKELPSFIWEVMDKEDVQQVIDDYRADSLSGEEPGFLKKKSSVIPVAVSELFGCYIDEDIADSKNIYVDVIRKGSKATEFVMHW